MPIPEAQRLRHRCTGQRAAMTSMLLVCLLIWVPTWRRPAARLAPRWITRSATAAGPLRTCWCGVGRGWTGSGMPLPLVCLAAWSNCFLRSPPLARLKSTRRSGTPAAAASSAPQPTCWRVARTSISFRRTTTPRRWAQPPRCQPAAARWPPGYANTALNNLAARPVGPLSSLLYSFDTVVRLARRNIHLDCVANAAVFQGAADWRLDGDASVASVHLAWTNQHVVQLFVELQVAQHHFAAESCAFVGGLALDNPRCLNLPFQAIDLALHFAHAALGLIVRRVFAKVAVLVCGSQVVAYRWRNFRLQVVQLSLQQ